MKKRIIAMLLMATTAIFLTACWSENAVEEEGDNLTGVVSATEVATEDSPAEEVAPIEENTYIKPQAFVYDLANPTDADLAAAFNISDLNTEMGELTFKAYSLDVYDAVQISMLQQGDILIYDGKEIVVDNIEDKSGDLYINGGLDDGGCVLVSHEGGTYVGRGYDDMPTYTEIGTLTLPVSESTKISDSYSNPSSPVEVSYEDIQNYISSIDGAKATFTYFSTIVQVSGGKVVGITRQWTP